MCVVYVKDCILERRSRVSVLPFFASTPFLCLSGEPAAIKLFGTVCVQCQSVGKEGREGCVDVKRTRVLCMNCRPFLFFSIEIVILCSLWMDAEFLLGKHLSAPFTFVCFLFFLYVVFVWRGM